MTQGRAAVIGLIDRYLVPGFGYPISLLEIQKLVYLLTEAGEALNQVHFVKHSTVRTRTCCVTYWRRWKRRFLDLIRYFVVFEDMGRGELAKKMAGYHQFPAVRVALEETLRAASTPGDRRVGVVWHTQGSGKSLTMSSMRDA